MRQGLLLEMRRIRKMKKMKKREVIRKRKREMTRIKMG